tara:strand:+ start:186 stop:935 length:750 start_codon:yes stop_codon:yes gene_type:complete
MSDNDISDNDISDNDISYNDISDNDISDNDISDNDISDNNINYISNNYIYYINIYDDIDDDTVHDINDDSIDDSIDDLSYNYINNNSTECCICLEHVNTNVFFLYDYFINNYIDISPISCIKTQCGHFFHSKCLYLNNLKYSTCPLCRQPFVNNIINNDINNDINNIINNDINNIINNNINNNNQYIITNYTGSYNVNININNYYLFKIKLSPNTTRFIYIDKCILKFSLLILLLLTSSLTLIILDLIY